MSENTNEDTTTSITSVDHKDEETSVADSSNETSHDPVKEALDKEQGKVSKKYTPAQKAAHALRMNAQKLRELGGNPEEVLGKTATRVVTEEDATEVDEDDNKPMTRGEFKRLKAEETTQSALQLADSQIENDSERELAKTYLRTRIRPSGDPQEDLESAMALVNSIKNKQVATEVARRSTTVVRRSGSGSGAPGRHEETFKATPEELSAARIAHVRPENINNWILNMRKDGEKAVKFGTARKMKMAEEAKRAGF